MPRQKTIRYDSTSYPEALQERGIEFHDHRSTSAPSNYDDMKKAISRLPVLTLPSAYNEKTIGGHLGARMCLVDQFSSVKADKKLLFPVVTVEVKGNTVEEHAQHQNMHNSAVMLRNLRTLRENADMSVADLKTKFDGIAHVITINCTKAEIVCFCCWSGMADDRFVEYHSKQVAAMGRTDGSDIFHDMISRILIAVDWATNTNKEWIRDDLKALEPRVSSLPALVPAASMPAGEVTSME
ncbi:hypothetical protein EK21DRAFT_87809 [Setomelanomma holmii]|uniref:DUF7924 domain-containing protein n=1 Tax=Setomelanomma holmii TaxID=210430 RepID=A0A9P4HEW3_9PLEO|nr:hypothetical protein EK21DRAFT_87809 [Setomelanomma holmii]